MHREPFKILFLQLLKFSIVGVSNTVIGLLVYYLLLAFHVHYLAANIAGFIISTGNAYLLNKKFVFKVKPEQQKTHKKAESVIKVYLVYLLSFCIGMLNLHLMVEYLGISEKIGPLINVCITTPMNYILNKYWAMKA